MRILFLSSYVDPGAGPSVLNRLAGRLKHRGHDVRILTTYEGFDSDIIKSVRAPLLLHILNKVLRRLVPDYFSFVSGRLMKEIHAYRPDVINIHWTHGPAIPIQIIPRLCEEVPVAWTMHDLWAVSAHRYFDDVQGRVLATSKPSVKELILGKLQVKPGFLLNYKVWLLGKVRVHTISPSRWMYDIVRSSPVFRSGVHHYIPNGVDVETFCPLDRQRLRQKYGIGQGRRTILFLSASVTDPRKGFYYYVKALEHLKSTNRDLLDNMTTLMVGKNTAEVNEYLPTEVVNLGSTREAAVLAEYYNLADVFVSTSIADNLPSTILESSASGTPVVAFSVGGIPDIVIDRRTGLLSDSKDFEGLAVNIDTILSDENLRGALGSGARQHICNNFSMDRFVDGYLSLFENVVGAR